MKQTPEATSRGGSSGDLRESLAHRAALYMCETAWRMLEARRAAGDPSSAPESQTATEPPSGVTGDVDETL